MHNTLASLLQREKLRTVSISAGFPGAKKPGQGADAEEGVEDKWEKENSQMKKPSLRQEPDEFPMHTISISNKKKTPKQQAMRQNFLRQAVGGNPNGFVTRTPLDHNVAKGLAKTGHLNHMGSMVDEKSGRTIHHWQLSEKGLALAHGSSLNPNAAMNNPSGFKPMPGKAGGFGAGRKMAQGFAKAKSAMGGR